MLTTILRAAARLAAPLALAAILAPAASAHFGPHPTRWTPALARAYQGLEYTAVGPCAGIYRIRTTSYCTHGPDPEPEPSAGVRLVRPAALAGAQVAGPDTKVECVGDGTSGKRVQVMYVRASDVPDAYQASKAAIGQGAVAADRVFRESAAETSGSRHIRFVHDASCNLSILNVVVDPSALAGAIGPTINALKALGYDSTDRKYLLFVDHGASSDVNCGVATADITDDQPGPANRSNVGPSYARIGPNCWTGNSQGNSTAAHELMHTLGAVKSSAPNWNGAGHCLDDTDRMCYDQKVPGFVFNATACLNHENLFDCNHDDYYSTDPTPGSYLDTHWNTANNDFLDRTLRGLWGFVKADDPAAASYTPASDFNQNETGAKNTVTRTGTGVYDVAFTNQAHFSGQAGAPLVTALGSAGEYCNTSAWSGSLTPDETVTVRCFSAAGTPTDVQFDAAYIRPIPASGGDVAYVWADDETSPSYTPSTAHQFNSTGAVDTVLRSATGVYTVTLPGLGSTGGTAKVTAYSSSSSYCKPESWAASGTDELVQVRCFDSTGAAVNSQFTLAWADGTSILADGASSAYALADKPSTASYTPAAATSFNSTGAANTVVRTGTGLYTVTLPGLGSGAAPLTGVNRGTVHVAATTSSSKRCEVTSWSSGFVVAGNPVPLNVGVACQTSGGSPADSKFALQFSH